MPSVIDLGEKKIHRSISAHSIGLLLATSWFTIRIKNKQSLIPTLKYDKGLKYFLTHSHTAVVNHVKGHKLGSLLGLLKHSSWNTGHVYSGPLTLGLRARLSPVTSPLACTHTDHRATVPELGYYLHISSRLDNMTDTFFDFWLIWILWFLWNISIFAETARDKGNVQLDCHIPVGGGRYRHQSKTHEKLF